MLASYSFDLFFNKGVGDGGNELGMGKVKEAVKKHIKNGDTIACDVEADFTIVAGKGILGCGKVDVAKRTEKETPDFPTNLYWPFHCMIKSYLTNKPVSVFCPLLE